MTKITKDFFVYQWIVEEERDSTIIKCFGIDENNNRAYIKIEDYTPYCYVELPDTIKWNKDKVTLVMDKLSSLNKNPKAQPITRQFVKRKKLYYCHKKKVLEGDKYVFKDKLFPFIFFTFNSTESLRNFVYQTKKQIDIIDVGFFKFNVYETEYDVSQAIRLICLNKIPPAGWIKVTGINLNEKDKESVAEYEINCSYKCIENSKRNDIIIPNVMSFDNEANSTVTTAMPNPSNPNDKVFQIGITTLIKNKTQKYLLSLGNPDKQYLEDIIIKTYKTEADLLSALTEFIQEYKINVVIGYNILGWDIDYMIKRCKFNRCLSDFDTIGLITNKHCKEEPIKFKSNAYGEQTLIYINAEGVLFLDLLPIIKREHKLVNYRLKTVTTHFGLPTKDPLSPQDIFKSYREFTPKSLGIVGKYCVQDSYITLLLFQKLNIWYGLCEMSKTTNVPIFYLFTKGTQIQSLSQEIRYCMHNNFVCFGDKSIEYGDYIGAKVIVPSPGFYKKVACFDFKSLYPSIMIAYNIDYTTFIKEPEHILIGQYDNIDNINWFDFPCYLKVSNIEDLPLFSLAEINIKEIYEKIFDRDELIDTIKKWKKTYKNKVFLIMKEKSIYEDCDCNVFQWEDHSNCEHDIGRKKKKNGEFSTAKAKIICDKRYFRFLKWQVAGKGVIPSNLEKLNAQRAATRVTIKENEKVIKTLIKELINLNDIDFLLNFKENNGKFFEGLDLKKEKNIDEKNIDEKKTLIIEKREKLKDLELTNQVLDRRQLSYKVCANSKYGGLGAKFSSLSLIQGASVVTYVGRTAIDFISKYIPENYKGILTYGDTDSMMGYFPQLNNNREIIETVNKILKDVNRYFIKPMELDFEKIYEKYLILSKKRYITLVSNLHGEICDKIFKGCCIARRDNCGPLRNIYKKVSNDILNEVSKEEILEYCIDELNNIFQRKYNFKDFVITKSLNSEYKGVTKPCHAQLADRMKERGQVLIAGSKIEYIFIDKGQDKKNLKQGERVEDVDFFRINREYLRVDFLEYLSCQIMKPCDELLNVAFGIENFFKTQYMYRLQHYYVLEELKNKFNNVVFEDEEIENSYKKEKEKLLKRKITINSKAINKLKGLSPQKKDNKKNTKKKKIIIIEDEENNIQTCNEDTLEIFV